MTYLDIIRSEKTKVDFDKFMVEIEEGHCGCDSIQSCHWCQARWQLQREALESIGKK